ncbi:MAG: glycoside hydrolase family 36 protein [Chloroflexota bacterium]
MHISHITLDSVPQSPDSQIVNATSLRLKLPQPPISFYRHGWQSWSLTAWTDPFHELPAMKPASFQSRQTDPVYARHPHPNGSWLGAAELADGSIIFMGALALDAHVSIHDGILHGWYESGIGDWFVAQGSEIEIFSRYASLLGQRFGRSNTKPSPRVWCSWYSLYNTIKEETLLNVLSELADLPFDVFQIDDGWQINPGEWEPNEKFPSGMDTLAARIKATGRKAGLWLAPLVVGKTSDIYKDHQDWLLHDYDGNLFVAGFEWSTDTYALDTTHPEVMEWLKNLIRKVRAWGYDYLKLDFLSAGAQPGKRHLDIPRETAYRQTLQVIREAAGDAYLLLCGTPILPALGICDAIRIGADVGNWWDSRFYSYLLYNQTTPGLQNGIRTTVHRLWLKSLVNVDPDVAFFTETKSLTPDQKQLFLDLTEICGVKATSDLPDSWSPSQRIIVRQWLEASPAINHTGRYTFTIDGRTVDFSPAIPLPPIPKYFDALLGEILGFLGNQLWALKIWHRLIRYQATKK